jgi:hypothetical protein
MNRESLCQRVAFVTQLLGFPRAQQSLHQQVALFLIPSDLFLREHADPPLWLNVFIDLSQRATI